MSVADHLDIVNAACAELAVEPLQDLEEDTLGGQAAGLVYFPFIDFCLGLKPWSFATRHVQLAEVTASVTPLLGYTHVHRLPAERIGPPEALRPTARRDCQAIDPFEYDENGNVHSDEPVLHAFGPLRVDPIAWPALFRQAAIIGFAGKIAELMTGNSSLGESRWRQAFGTPSELCRGGLMGVALAKDSTSTPPRRLPFANPLTNAWGSG